MDPNGVVEKRAWMRRFFGRRITLLIVMVAGGMLVVEGPLQFPHARRFRSVSPPVQGPEPKQNLQVHSNITGGFRFSYPDNWIVRSDGPRTELRNPTGEVFVGFGRAPEGPLAEASRVFSQRTLSAYGEASIVTRQTRRIGRLPARIVFARAVNGSERLRVLAIVVDAGSKNLSLTVVNKPEGDPDPVLSQLEDVVSSFRPLR